ncbi:MAG: ELWxxDGT repeat protein [Chitinophagaceae bacterium]
MSRKLYPVLLLSILFFQTSVFSQSFSLLKDINSGNTGSSYFDATNVNGILYFRPDDGVHGDELWKSNGTAAGTVLVKDINPGADGSELQEFTNVNGLLYFRANDGVHGAELWKSDGTAAGTVMVKDIHPGQEGSISSTLFALNGNVYFQANDGTHGTELWKSDGTDAGTVMLKDIYPGIVPSGFLAGTPYSGNPGNFTSVNGIVYFAASGGNETHEVWKTDGTVAGTTLIKDIYSGVQGYALSNFITLNGTLYFTVYGGDSGNELWKSNGTAAGTVLVKTMSGDNFTNHATVMNGALYFLEGDGLWKSDGTTSGTVLLKEKGGSFAFSPELVMAVNGLIYFTGNDDAHGLELWKSDGTEAGTVLLKDIYSGSTSSDINAFAKVGNKLMFSANDGIHGNEIWISDGTNAGTKMVQDVEPGAESSMESQFYELKTNIVEVNGKIFAGATTSAFGNEIWVANAPADGPLPVELLEFKGSLINNNGFLQWKTENETNISVFIIERSIDANNYSPIGTLLPSNTAGIHGYTLTDPNLTSLGVPVVYYRLRQVDMDGKFKYSAIVTLSIENKNITSIRLYSNPVKSHINLSITSYQAVKLQWRVTDNIGRIIKAGTYSISAGINLLSEDIGFVSSGVYYMQLFNGSDLKQTIKVLKQ